MPPLKFDVSEEALDRDTTISFFIGSGPGGQNRNKRETGVRLVHHPSGLVVTSVKERSQGQNRADALSKLRQKLIDLMHVEKPRRPTKPSKGSKRRRLEGKRQTGDKKAQRQRPAFD